MSREIATFIVPGRIVAKIRFGRDKSWHRNKRTGELTPGAKRVIKYTESQREIIAACWGAMAKVLDRPALPLAFPVRIGVAAYVAPVKSGKNRGKAPATAGDFDNLMGAVMDALQKSHGPLQPILAGDDAARVVGPGMVRMERCDVEPGVYVCEPGAERVVVTLWRADGCSL